MLAQVEDDDQIARKERRHARAELARVPDGLLALGQEDPIFLIFKLRLGALLGVRQCVDDVPAFAATQCNGMPRRELRFESVCRRWTGGHHFERVVVDLVVGKLPLSSPPRPKKSMSY